MAAYIIVGLVLVIAFLCMSHAIPEMAHRHPNRVSPPRRPSPEASKK